jgi:hypothetical protein
VVAEWSLDRMVEGYQDLIHEIYCAKAVCTPDFIPSSRLQASAARTE